MNNKYQIDPQFRILRPLRIKKYTRPIRLISNACLRFISMFTRPSFQFSNKKIVIKKEGFKKIVLRVHKLRKNKHKSPLLFYMPGGGFQLEPTPIHLSMLRRIIKEANIMIVTIRYSLVPKYPYPTALNECYDALLYLKKNHEKYKFDLNQLYVGGDSAGGNLAAALSILARDEKEVKIKKQMLIYPVIDATQKTESMKLFTDTPMWNSINNQQMWNLYLNNRRLRDLPYASPNLCELNDLPEAYIEVAEFDCLRDEGINYANQLKKAKNNVKLIETKGTVHGYDALYKKPIVKNLINERVNFIKNKV
ncbi:MAG: alpha/beta hydrolase [Acholeplasmataceae bacterium]